jgi:hypothetical protein
MAKLWVHQSKEKTHKGKHAQKKGKNTKEGRLLGDTTVVARSPFRAREKRILFFSRLH